MTNNIQHFKELLEKERDLITKNLSEIGVKNPSNEADWKGKPEDIDAERADHVDVADNIEEYESNNAVVAELEVRLVNINNALSKIESGSYGTCSECGGDIEDERLEANPAAATCKTHIKN